MNPMNVELEEAWFSTSDGQTHVLSDEFINCTDKLHMRFNEQNMHVIEWELALTNPSQIDQMAKILHSELSQMIVNLKCQYILIHLKIIYMRNSVISIFAISTKTL